MKRAYADRYADLYRSHWWWQARETLIADCLATLALPQDARILAVGCGDALAFPLLERFGSVRGIETDEELLSPGGRYRDRIDTDPLGDARRGGSEYDLVTAFDVLEHMEDDRGAVRDMHRLLRPNGHLVVTVPAHPSLWSSHDDANQHHRRYRRRELIHLLEPGFEPIRIRHLFVLLSIPKWILARWERPSARDRDPRASTIHSWVPPEPLNALLRTAAVLEGKITMKMPLPFGSSLLAVARKI